MNISLAQNIAVVAASGIVGAFSALAALALRAARAVGHGHYAKSASVLAISALLFSAVTIAGVFVSPVAIDWMNAWYGVAGGILLVLGSFVAGSGALAPSPRPADQPHSSGHST